MKYYFLLLLLDILASVQYQILHVQESPFYNGQKMQSSAEELKQLESFYVQKKSELELQQKRIQIGFLLGLFLLSFGSFFLIWKQQKLRTQFRRQQAEQLLLRLQMKPHFLFNALASIQSFLFEEQDKVKALQYLAKFAHLMRQVLSNAQASRIALAQDVQMLEHYLSIQQLRFDQQFKYKIEIESGLSTWKTFVPPFLLHPFVESAIEQGHLNKVENGWIKIRMKREKGDILLIIEDNGIRRFFDETKEITPLKAMNAIALTKERLLIINRIWTKSILFNCYEMPGNQTKIVFKIPITLSQ